VLTDTGLDLCKVSMVATASGLTIPPPWHTSTLAVLHWGVLRLYVDSGIQHALARGGGVGRKCEAHLGNSTQGERWSVAGQVPVSVAVVAQRIRSSALGQGLSWDQLLYLATGSRAEWFSPGQALFSSDEPPSCVAVVLQGLALVAAGDGAVLARLSPGER
jgi:hypothetical protein